MTRDKIFAEINAEREAQDIAHGGPASDDTHSLNDWIAILARHVGLAASDGAAEDRARCRRQLIRVAAVAVAAAEAMDRQSSDMVAGKHTPGSGW